MKSKLIILVLIIFSISLVSAGDQSLMFNYNFANSTLIEKTVDFSSVLFKINTDQDASCKYGTTQGSSYQSLDGVFDLSSGKFHEKSFTELGDGIYHYYIKCSTSSFNITEPPELAILLRVNSLVTAQIALSETIPLKPGKKELTLVTSKVVPQQPSLTYSFDSLIYNNLPLFGSGTIWKGYLLIPKNLQDAVVSFKFSANDLEGRQGTQIKGNSIFIIDNLKPATISYVNAIGKLGEIELDWHDIEEDVDVYNIYRYTSPNVDYTDFISTSKGNNFIDKSVEKGKTYYYRIAGEDIAGNIADLSKEVYATVLRENFSSSTTSSQLSQSLIGKVENFVTEINSLVSEIDLVRSNLESKNKDDRDLFTDLGLLKEGDLAKSELISLKNEADKLKMQDLTEDELNKKIDGLRLKLSVSKKKVPDTLSVLERSSRQEVLSDENILEAIFSINSSLTEKESSNALKETKNFLSQKSIAINSNFFLAEIIYLDGSRRDMDIVKRTISGEVERMDKSYFVESVSKDVAESASQIKFKAGGGYEILKEDPVLSFGSDTKVIIYYVEDSLDISDLENTKMTFVKLPSIEPSSKITGYSIYQGDSLRYGGLILGVLVILTLLIYFIKLRKRKLSVRALDLKSKISNLNSHLDKGDLASAKELYSSLRLNYASLGVKERSLFKKEMDELRLLIVSGDIKKAIDSLEESFDNTLYHKLIQVYSTLPNNLKNEFKDKVELLKIKYGGVET